MAEAEANAYDDERGQRMARNREGLSALGLEENPLSGAAQAAAAAAATAPRPALRQRQLDGSASGGTLEPTRRSRRLQGDAAEHGPNKLLRMHGNCKCALGLEARYWEGVLRCSPAPARALPLARCILPNLACTRGTLEQGSRTPVLPRRARGGPGGRRRTGGAARRRRRRQQQWGQQRQGGTGLT